MTFLANHGWLLTLLVLVAPLVLAAPAVVATVRSLPDARKIVVLNVAGAVFFSAWAAAMAWAVIGKRDVGYYDKVMRHKWRYLGISLTAGLALLVASTIVGGNVAAAIRSPAGNGFQTAAVTRGSLVAAVSATGKLRASKVVQVASQASGAVVDVMVKPNDLVRRGQLIARIDPATYLARVRQAEAALARAVASRADAAASSQRAFAALSFASSDGARKEALFSRGFVSRSDMDRTSDAISERRGQIGQARAAAASAEATIAQARSELVAAKVDLARTYVRSPVDGTVLARRVEPGQIVVSSFQTTTLFDIAEDLTTMRVEAQVDEADVGAVREGQSATFEVDAYPGRRFTGRVSSIQRFPTEAPGAVTYPVWISAANPDGALLTGMTADVRILQASRVGVLKVPDAALEFDRATSGRGGAEGDRVFAVRKGEIATVPVRVGLRSDGQAQVTGGLRPGDLVVTGRKREGG